MPRKVKQPLPKTATIGRPHGTEVAIVHPPAVVALSEGVMEAFQSIMSMCDIARSLSSPGNMRAR